VNPVWWGVAVWASTPIWVPPIMWAGSALADKWRWDRHTGQALAVANSRRRHPSEVKDVFWICRDCGRRQWTTAPRVRAEYAAHVDAYHRDPVGPEDDAEWWPWAGETA
jgi:hypothetical protein